MEKTNQYYCACDWQAGRQEDKWSVRSDLKLLRLFLISLVEPVPLQTNDSLYWEQGERCVAVLSCFPAHAKISTAGMLMTLSKRRRPLSLLLLMAALRATHPLMQNHIIGVCICLCVRTLCICNHSSVGTDPSPSVLSCRLVRINTLSHMCSFPKSHSHMCTLNKTLNTICMHTQTHTHTTSTTPSYQLKQILSLCPPSSNTATGWGHDSCQVDGVSWFITPIAFVLPNQASRIH